MATRTSVNCFYGLLGHTEFLAKGTLMYTTCNKLLPVLALSMFAFLSPTLNANNPELECKTKPIISQNVIPPGTPLNHYNLLLHIGQDDQVPVGRAIDFSTAGFSTILGWDDAQVTTFREAAIQWFIERFGIDFSTGTFDPVSGRITTDFGIMLPYTYQGYNRVLGSNNELIPAYTPITPSSVTLVQYSVAFFSTPTYTGTYAANVPGGAIIGNQSDNISYGCWRIFLNYRGTKTQTFFSRTYYPSIITEDNANPTRNLDRYQLCSSVFGPGYATTDSAIGLTEVVDGKVGANAHTIWHFPGAFYDKLSDYNGFTTPPLDL
jgi:hypothetical protein